MYIRKRKNRVYFWCKDKRNEIILDECKNCLKRNLKRNKGIKRVSQHRKTVSNDTYNKVLERDKNTCRLLDSTCEGWLELHHIIYRSENRDLIDEPSNCIMLCKKHHLQVHSNKHYWQEKLKSLVNSVDSVKEQIYNNI